jgi:hypothetical protein
MIKDLFHPENQSSMVKNELATFMQGLCLFTSIMIAVTFACWKDTCPCINHPSALYALPVFGIALAFSIKGNAYKTALLTIVCLILIYFLHQNGASDPCLNCIHDKH